VNAAACVTHESSVRRGATVGAVREINDGDDAGLLLHVSCQRVEVVLGVVLKVVLGVVLGGYVGGGTVCVFGGVEPGGAVRFATEKRC